MWIHAAVSSSIVLLCCLTGLIIYAKYFDCDPITSKVIAAIFSLFTLADLT